MATTEPTPTMATIPFKPTAPKFGGLTEVGTGHWEAWTGGKPKADWTGLEDPDPVNITSTQYRQMSIGSSAKSRAYRINVSSDNKSSFTRTSDLQVFQKKIMKHLVTYGMDTITYVSSPTDPTQVVSVIDNHALFTLTEGAKTGNSSKLTNFDSYSHANDEDAKEYLLNYIDEDLEKQLYENCADDDSFVTMWLNLIHLIRGFVRLGTIRIKNHGAGSDQLHSPKYLKCIGSSRSRTRWSITDLTNQVSDQSVVGLARSWNSVLVTDPFLDTAISFRQFQHNSK